MDIAIATKNMRKIKGISEAFRKYFPEEQLSFKSYLVDSKVGEQPINDEVFLGAKNRLDELKERNLAAKYLVSCESGLLKQYDKWYNYQIVLIETEGVQHFGLSPGYEIPEKYVEKIIDNGLGNVFDELFDGRGGISILTYGITNRITLVKEATLMALSAFNWK